MSFDFAQSFIRRTHGNLKSFLPLTVWASTVLIFKLTQKFWQTYILIFSYVQFRHTIKLDKINETETVDKIFFYLAKQIILDDE